MSSLVYLLSIRTRIKTGIELVILRECIFRLSFTAGDVNTFFPSVYLFLIIRKDPP